MFALMFPKPEPRKKRRGRPEPEEVGGRVDPAEHRFVRERDRMCFLARIDDNHVCASMGFQHRATDIGKLTVEHVWPDAAAKQAFRRAPSTRRSMVAICHAGNIKPPSAEEREAMRSFLVWVNEGRRPEDWRWG